MSAVYGSGSSTKYKPGAPKPGIASGQGRAWAYQLLEAARSQLVTSGRKSDLPDGLPLLHALLLTAQPCH